METIKKFKNRKLYSTKLSKYVTLTDLVTRLRNKEEFTVLEHGTNNDITNKTLKQALVNVNIPEDTLRRLIIGE